MKTQTQEPAYAPGNTRIPYSKFFLPPYSTPTSLSTVLPVPLGGRCSLMMLLSLQSSSFSLAVRGRDVMTTVLFLLPRLYPCRVARVSAPPVAP